MAGVRNEIYEQLLSWIETQFTERQLGYIAFYWGKKSVEILSNETKVSPEIIIELIQTLEQAGELVKIKSELTKKRNQFAAGYYVKNLPEKMLDEGINIGPF